tara:strand:+ start:8252 stop:9079 length:828 start_codon:yes stop_codon:yes gene_type:complete
MIGKNIIELQNELSYMPMEKLVSLVDDPNSMYGSLTLIEIQNRKALTDGAKTSQPIPTVAEDIVSSVAPSASLESTSPNLSNQGSGGIAGIPRDQLMGRLPAGGLQDILDSQNEQVQQYNNKGEVELMGKTTMSPLEQLREAYGYQNQEEFDKEKRMLMMMQLGSNIAGAEEFSDVVEGNTEVFTTRMALDKQRREDDMGLAALRLKGLSDPSDVKSLTGSLAEMETLGFDQPNSQYHNLYLEILRKLDKELSVTQSTGIDTIKADVSPVAPSGV